MRQAYYMLVFLIDVFGEDWRDNRIGWCNRVAMGLHQPFWNYSLVLTMNGQRWIMEKLLVLWLILYSLVVEVFPIYEYSKFSPNVGWSYKPFLDEEWICNLWGLCTSLFPTKRWNIGSKSIHGSIMKWLVNHYCHCKDGNMPISVYNLDQDTLGSSSIYQNAPIYPSQIVSSKECLNILIS